MSETLKELETELALPGLAQRLGSALAVSADPEGAETLAIQVLLAATEKSGEAAAEEAQIIVALWKRCPDEVCRILAALCGAAPFLARILGMRPAWLASLAGEDIEKPRTPADYSRLADEALAATPVEKGGLHLFKYYELARITVRDVAVVPEARAGETLAEISHLADAVLFRALTWAQEQVREKYGEPLWKDTRGHEVRLEFAVLGLGKLGSEELNYSSDVDLIYIYQSPRHELDLASHKFSPPEYFARLAQTFGRLMAERRPEGFLYRVDLDLRPEGSRGPLVVSSEAFVAYYEAWAATWEKAAFMKARSVAGNRDFGWHVVRSLDPVIYRSTMDFAGVDAIKKMKAKVEAETSRKSDTFNIKLGEGGIRDVEFVAQALQLLHGGRMPQVRVRSTQEAISALAGVGILKEEEASKLLAAYRFLRRAENRVQMVAEQQTHSLPAGKAELSRIARGMGFVSEADPVAVFEEKLSCQRAIVREIFSALFHEERDEQILALFHQTASALFQSPVTRNMAEAMAAHFAREVSASSDPERALNNLRRFIEGVGGRSFYYGLLLDRPELVERLTKLFASSDYLSDYMAFHPRLIEPVFSDPNVLLLSRKDLETNLRADQADLGLEKDPANIEAALDALRQFRNRETINIGLLDIDEKITLEAAESSLTEVAEVCIEEGLAIADRQLSLSGRTPPKGGEFLVVGMGKLASGELSYGSDLDVIFLFDAGEKADPLEAQEAYVRLAQRFISTLQTRTGAGVCYEIDARLRPSGSQGMLVTSIGSFEKYHEQRAAIWERQALLRARPVAGGGSLSRKFLELRRTILLKDLPADAAAEIHRIRLRMEKELGHETSQHRDVKVGRGGLLDVENAVQFLQLKNARQHEELLVPATAGRILDRLYHLQLLDQKDYLPLRKGWEFLKFLTSRLRIVENKSISDLDERRGDLHTLALRMGYDGGERDATARRRLLDDYRRHTETIREVYERVMGI